MGRSWGRLQRRMAVDSGFFGVCRLVLSFSSYQHPLLTTRQDAADTLSPEQLASMDEQINTLKSSIPSLKTTQRNLTLKLNTLLSAPTTAALHTLISSIQQENKLKAEKLREFKEGAVKMVTKEEVSKVGREVKEWAVKRKKRMDAFKGLEAMLMQGPWSKEELWEKAGVEEDCYVPPSERQLLTPKY